MIIAPVKGACDRGRYKMPVWTVDLVANKAQMVAPKNPKRICISVKNDSAANVYYGHEEGVSTSGYRQGWLIDPNGGSLEDEFHKGEVWLISPSSVSVTILEDVEELKSKE